jgi:hypothetical protein
MINYKHSNNFNSHIILGMTKKNKRMTYNIIHKIYCKFVKILIRIANYFVCSLYFYFNFFFDFVLPTILKIELERLMHSEIDIIFKYFIN